MKICPIAWNAWTYLKRLPSFSEIGLISFYTLDFSGAVIMQVLLSCEFRDFDQILFGDVKKETQIQKHKN